MSNHKYIDTSLNIIKEKLPTMSDSIRELASELSTTMKNDGVIQLMGVDQDYAFRMELGYRAGGLGQFHGLDSEDLVLRGIVSAEDAKNMEASELAEKMWSIYNIHPQDSFLFYVSGSVDPIMLEIAKLAKKNNHVLHVVGNVVRDKDSEIYTIADKVIDTDLGEIDLTTDVNGVAMGPVSNLVGNLFAQCLTLELFNSLEEQGVEVNVLWSANIVGADEHNATITDPYEGRWNA